VVQNNVLYCNPATNGSPVYVVGGSSVAQPTCLNPTIDRNDVYVGANASALRDIRTGSTINYATFALLQSVGFDVHGKNADPGLVNEATPSRPEDFVPPPSSPALDMGADLRSIVASDYFGAAFTLPVPAGAIAARRRSMASTRAPGVRSMAGVRSGASTRGRIMGSSMAQRSWAAIANAASLLPKKISRKNGDPAQRGVSIRNSGAKISRTPPPTLTSNRAVPGARSSILR